jgi:hypothetical protein
LPDKVLVIAEAEKQALAKCSPFFAAFRLARGTVLPEF